MPLVVALPLLIEHDVGAELRELRRRCSGACPRRATVSRITEAMPITMPSTVSSERSRCAATAPHASRIASPRSARSHRRASAATGSSRAARRAGAAPKSSPTEIETSDRGDDRPERRLRRESRLERRAAGPFPANAAARPTTPPAVDRSAASTRNTATTWRAVTPSALSRPISRVRSETETSMTFMMPMPATVSEIAAMPARAAVSSAEDAAERRRAPSPA